MIERGEDVEVEGRVIEGDLDLSKAKLEMDEDGKFLVTASIKIRNSEIQKLVIFENAIFQNEINFENTNFNDGANFYDSQ